MSNGGMLQVQPYQWRSEEHTSELQSLRHVVCRLLLGKKESSYSFFRPCVWRCLEVAECADQEMVGVSEPFAHLSMVDGVCHCSGDERNQCDTVRDELG